MFSIRLAVKEKRKKKREGERGVATSAPGMLCVLSAKVLLYFHFFGGVQK